MYVYTTWLGLAWLGLAGWLAGWVSWGLEDTLKLCTFTIPHSITTCCCDTKAAVAIHEKSYIYAYLPFALSFLIAFPALITIREFKKTKLNNIERIVYVLLHSLHHSFRISLLVIIILNECVQEEYCYDARECESNTNCTAY
uniref:Uncharacterized protein n=1 Tax=Glossina brevipalpis TaxID=37001 RepID=A0A1A9W989_9MUSC